jgi:hypothetical protein
MVQTDQTKGDIESRERAYQKELKDLRSQLSEMTHEKQLQKESVLQAERSNKNIQLELEEKEKAMQKLKDEVTFIPFPHPSLIVSNPYCLTASSRKIKSPTHGRVP